MSHNPFLTLKRYAERHLHRWGYDADRFLRDCGYLDDTLDLEECRRIYETCLRDSKRPLKPVHLTIFDPEILTGYEPEVFCRQPHEDERREHPGGAPQIAFEDGCEDERVPTLVVEFDYALIDGEYDQEQRQRCVTATEMLLWLQEPLVTCAIKNSTTPNMLRYKQQVLILILCPAALGNPTVSELAIRLGTTRQTLGKIVKDFKLRYPEVLTNWMKSAEARKLLEENDVALDSAA